MDVIKIKELDPGFSKIIFTACLFAVGTFHEYLSCVASLAMIIWLLYVFKAKKQLSVYKNLTFAAAAVALLFYLLTAFWAVDAGMALVGFVKFLPAPLFLLVLMQTRDREEVISVIPFAAVFMTVVSAVCMQIPALRGSFSVAGRLAGFFQYPNTFALVALAGELILLAKEKLRYYDYIMAAVLIFGIVYSGSRTVFALAAAANIALIFAVKPRRVKLAFAAFLGLAAVAAGAAALIWGASLFGRFSRFSLSESTFAGRLLYFYDALPVILKHPFGLGYMGYFYIQQSVQTGVYSVMYVHNDFLQLALDVGWIPALLFAAAVIKAVFWGKKPFYMRLILAVIALHACFDFDMQFAGVFMLMLLFTDHTAGKETVIKKKDFTVAAGVILSAVCLYFGTALTLARFGNNAAALAVYPLDTRAETAYLIEKSGSEKGFSAANNIIRRNKYVTVAYSELARQYFSVGDFQKVIEYKRAALDTAPFDFNEHQDYCLMLMVGVKRYREIGDQKSAGVCLAELKDTIEKVHSQNGRLSTLGKKIGDQPKTRLPDKIEEFE